MFNFSNYKSESLTFEERGYIAAKYEKWCDEQPIKVKKNALSMITFLMINDLIDIELVKCWIDKQERDKE